jgi:phosphate starvation-inducible protein PhoH
MTENIELEIINNKLSTFASTIDNTIENTLENKPEDDNKSETSETSNISNLSSKLIIDNMIEIAPLGMMRGRTFKHSWIVADEMQNSTISQMKMLLTRLGENSRIIVTGDLEQFDRVDKVNNTEVLNGLDDFLSKLRGKRSDSISSFEFDREDIQREEVVREVLEIYAAYEIPKSYAISNGDDSSSS